MPRSRRWSARPGPSSGRIVRRPRRARWPRKDDRRRDRRPRPRQGLRRDPRARRTRPRDSGWGVLRAARAQRRRQDHDRSSACDPARSVARHGARRVLWERIRGLRAASGLTVLLTTHYVEEAEPCDRVAVLDHGRLAALGTPAELKRATGVGSLEEVYLAHTGRRLAETDGA